MILDGYQVISISYQPPGYPYWIVLCCGKPVGDLKLTEAVNWAQEHNDAAHNEEKIIVIFNKILKSE